MALRLLMSLVFLVLVPIVSHVAVGNGFPVLWLGAADFVVAVFVVAIVSFDTKRSDFPKKLAWLALGAVLVMSPLFRLNSAYLVYLPPMMILGALAALFLATLQPGQVPLITRFASLERGGQMPDVLFRYTRRLTWAWGVFFLLLLVESVMLASFVSLETYIQFANSYNYAVIGAFFVLEYLYRRIRYRRFTHASPLAFVRLLLQASILKTGKRT